MPYIVMERVLSGELSAATLTAAAAIDLATKATGSTEDDQGES